MDARDDAIMGLMPLVVRIARKVNRQMPNFSIDDLISEGMIGAMQAVDRHEPERGVPLGAFAATRIKGQMLDHVRSYSWLSRQDYADTQAGTKEFSLRSLDEPVNTDDGREGDASLADLLPDDEDAIARMLDQTAMRTVLAQLPEKHRWVLLEYFYNERTLLDIANEHGVCESRICQRLKAAKRAAYLLLME